MQFCDIKKVSAANAVLVAILWASTPIYGQDVGVKGDIQATAKLPNITILATGGTIAGTGATSTTTVGYTSAKVGVEALIEAVPDLKKVAVVKGEQVFQIASENMNKSLLAKACKAGQCAACAKRC